MALVVEAIDHHPVVAGDAPGRSARSRRRARAATRCRASACSTRSTVAERSAAAPARSSSMTRPPPGGRCSSAIELRRRGCRAWQRSGGGQRMQRVRQMRGDALRQVAAESGERSPTMPSAELRNSAALALAWTTHAIRLPAPAAAHHAAGSSRRGGSAPARNSTGRPGRRPARESGAYVNPRFTQPPPAPLPVHRRCRSDRAWHRGSGG